MRNIIILALSLCSMAAFGQTEVKKEIKQEVKIENTDGKYQVTRITTENGETKTITKTYDSLAELENDPDMADVKVMSLHNKDHKLMFFSDDSLGHDKDLKVIIKGDAAVTLDAEQDMDTDSFVFKSGEGDSELHKIKIWVDEDGKKHITKDGVEIDSDSWTSEDGKTYDIKKLDGKVMFLSEDEAGEFVTEEGEHINVKVKVEAGEGNPEKKIIFVETITKDVETDGEPVESVVVKIVEEIQIHLEEVEENEFADVPGINAKVLNVDELNYYPNPSSGKFTLAFQANSKPTEIRITGVNGKEVYTEKLQSFEGSYSKVIDLTGQQAGIYLLQILQGKRVMNKKIVIE